MICAGCGSDQRAAVQWKATFDPPMMPAEGTLTPRTADSPADPGYFIYFCIDAPGVDFSSWDRLIKTVQSPPGRSKFEPSTGHSWIALQSPAGLRYRGHTGNEGMMGPTISDIFIHLNKTGHPDPILAMHQARNDGRAHDHPGRHRPAYVLKVPITQAEYQSVSNFIQLFDYRRFDLRSHQCTDFVVQAAWRVGLTPKSKVTIRLPNEARMWGRRVRFWTDPRFEYITMGCPDILAESMKEYAAQGIGTDATQFILDDLKRRKHD